MGIACSLLALTYAPTATAQDETTVEKAAPDPNRPPEPAGRPVLITPFLPYQGDMAEVTCGYGCYLHTDAHDHDYFAVDFAVKGKSKTFPVVAAAGGTLTRKDAIGQPSGNIAIEVYIDHGNGWRTYYTHLANVTVRGKTVPNGGSVSISQGEQLGMSGKTGAASIHLHFELRGGYQGTPPNEKNSWTYAVDDIIPCTGKKEFCGQYYTNPNMTGTPRYTRNTKTISAHWGDGGPGGGVGDNYQAFSIRWRGQFQFNKSDYDFYLGGDDGVRLWLDDKLIINKWVDQAYTEYNVRLPVSAGSHIITVEYYENADQDLGEAAVSFCVTPTGQNCAWYYNNSKVGIIPDFSAQERRIVNVWGYSSPSPSIKNNFFSAKYLNRSYFKSGTYTFCVGSDDAAKVSVDTTTIINYGPPHAFSWSKKEYTPGAGWHTVRTDYYELAGNAAVVEFWFPGTTPLTCTQLLAQRTTTNDSNDITGIQEEQIEETTLPVPPDVEITEPDIIEQAPPTPTVPLVETAPLPESEGQINNTLYLPFVESQQEQ